MSRILRVPFSPSYSSGGGGIDSYCKLMLHGDDLTDSSLVPKTVTNNGVTSSTDQSKFGGKSLFFNGSASLSLIDSDDWDFGTNDMNIDFWIYPTAVNGDRFIFYQSNGSAYHGIEVYNGNIYWQYHNGTAYVLNVFTTGTLITVNNWHHVLLTRIGSRVYIAINGIFVTLNGTQISSNSLPNLSSNLYIGSDTSGLRTFSGYIDEFRVSKGIARWTSNFTPPTEAYTA